MSRCVVCYYDTTEGEQLYSLFPDREAAEGFAEGLADKKYSGVIVAKIVSALQVTLVPIEEVEDE